MKKPLIPNIFSPWNLTTVNHSRWWCNMQKKLLNNFKENLRSKKKETQTKAPVCSSYHSLALVTVSIQDLFTVFVGFFTVWGYHTTIEIKSGLNCMVQVGQNHYPNPRYASSGMNIGLLCLNCHNKGFQIKIQQFPIFIRSFIKTVFSFNFPYLAFSII